MAADTSSPAATATDVVYPTAAAWAALTPDPIRANSTAADTNPSGPTTTNDITPLQPRRLLPQNLAPSEAEEARNALPGIDPDTTDHYLLLPQHLTTHASGLPRRMSAPIG